VNTYYRGAQGVILVYDMVDPDTIMNIKNVWLGEVERYAKEGVTIVLFGNKLDLASQPDNRRKADETRAIVQTILEQYPSIASLEGSAKEAEGIEDIFLLLVGKMMDIRRKNRVVYEKNASNGRVDVSMGRSIRNSASSFCCS
jgi:Ras-related protein Rab-1A